MVLMLLLENYSGKGKTLKLTIPPQAIRVV
jgi:hypothetical protein